MLTDKVVSWLHNKGFVESSTSGRGKHSGQMLLLNRLVEYSWNIYLSQSLGYLCCRSLFWWIQINYAKGWKSRKSVDFGKAICVYADDLIGENQVMNMSPDWFLRYSKYGKRKLYFYYLPKWIISHAIWKLLGGDGNQWTANHHSSRWALQSSLG